MPNWCSNYGHFTGSVEAINNLKECFSEMIKRSEEEKQATVPSFFPNKQCIDGFFFDIYCDELDVKDLDYVQIQWETRWCPNTPDVVEVCKKLNVNVEVAYNEPGCGVFGEYKYDHVEDNLEDIHLDDSDTSQYTYLDDIEMYLFRGNHYESDTEILEILLEERKEALR